MVYMSTGRAVIAVILLGLSQNRSLDEIAMEIEITFNIHNPGIREVVGQISLVYQRINDNFCFDVVT